MLKIRLQRIGRKKQPFYKIVVADARAPRDGKYIEKIGSYSPMLSKDDPNRVSINTDRVVYWLKCGAQPTDKVEKFIKKSCNSICSSQA